MEEKNKIIELVQKYRKQYALEGSAENIVVTIHLMNKHLVDITTALDQSSRSGDDFGIDGWYFDESQEALFIYQSKLSESKSTVSKGFEDLLRAKDWLTSFLIQEITQRVPSNNCLYNLATLLSKKKEMIKKINFILLSLYNPNELEDSEEYNKTRKELINSKLHDYMKRHEGKIDFVLDEYNCETALPHHIKEYSVTKLKGSTINTDKSMRLDLAYIPLYNLVDLYRQRGELLFNKNIRFSLKSSKEAKQRLVHPMGETFNLICLGKIDPNIFPFYHVGVTVAASEISVDEGDQVALKEPSVINGCQTITIADSFLRKLENDKEKESIDKFKQIRVIAKVVTNMSDDELREITNSNNRQNPIENWQLFSNEPIHIEIEDILKEEGIFYERQEGKFKATMKNAESFQFYGNTNGTYIKVIELGKIICLGKRKLQWLAKPSEIFVNKKNHDTVFTYENNKYSKDIILLYNLLKAITRALSKYLELPVHASNDYTHRIFSKAILKANIYYLALAHAYQNEEKYELFNYSQKLNKIASPNLVSFFESYFYPKVITKVKRWYINESNHLKHEVSSRRIELFINKVSKEIGVNLDKGKMPMCTKSIDWYDYNNS